MIVGLDFDNTIVCYDKAIGALAQQRFDLPPALPRTKVAIRDYLRSQGLEDAWTRFQGELYGPGMAHAEPFDGAPEVIQRLLEMGHRFCVISHRTRFPYLGERHDLHHYAGVWVRDRLRADFSSVTFHETKAEKIAMIERSRCDFFLDDLPEILSDPAFPTATKGVLFAPTADSTSWSGQQITDWRELIAVVQNNVRN